MPHASLPNVPRLQSFNMSQVSPSFFFSQALGVLTPAVDVMQVAHHYFENGIAHFTRRINKCISMACANGEVAPFVGHNAFLRWSALQDAAFEDRGDNNKKKIWSETNVSEDFDMALRLQVRIFQMSMVLDSDGCVQLKGFTIRWATYSEGGFKEGVSLTCDDELNRWQKYSYGEFPDQGSHAFIVG